MEHLCFKEWLNLAEAVLTFGKHRGKDIKDIPGGYLRWVLDNVSKLSPDLRGEIEQRLRAPIAAVAKPAAMGGGGNLGQQGYRVITAKWGPHAGKKVYWHPESKHMVPVDQPAVSATEAPMVPGMEVEPTKPLKISEQMMSKYQRDIENKFGSTDKNIMINALAGTGKTTMLRHLSSFRRPGEKWLYLVFNTKNAREATKGENAFGPGVTAKTSHSFLGNVLKNNAQVGKMHHTDLGKKMGSLLDSEWFENEAKYDLEIPFRLVYKFKQAVRKLSELAKHHALNPNENIRSDLEDLIDRYPTNIDTTLTDGMSNDDYTGEVIKMSLELLKRSLPAASGDTQLNAMRDHDDTLWYAALHADQLNWPRYNVVLADEVQDFNKAQLKVLEKLSQAGARIVAVGDPNQSLYRFRGADAHAFTNLGNLLGNLKGGATSLTLPENYRSAPEIVDYVNRNTKMSGLNPDQQLKAGLTHKGQVTEHQKYRDVMGTIGQEWGDNQEFKRGTAVIARTNKPLIHTALNLMKNNIPFEILGRDFADDLIKFINKVAKGWKRTAYMSIDDFWDEMHDYVAAKDEQWKGKAKKGGELSELKETSEAINGVLEFLSNAGWQGPGGMKIGTARDFVSYLKSVFGGINANGDSDGTTGAQAEQDAQKYKRLNKKKFVTLTTAHRAKGLQWGRVYVIRTDLFPHPRAIEGHAEELEQEENAKYVAYTRPTHELHVIDDPEPGGKK